MANIAEDLDAGLELATPRFPAPGERWQHHKGKVAKIILFDIARADFGDGALFYEYANLLIPFSSDRTGLTSVKAASNIKDGEQYVVYECGGQLYARAMSNFLEQFENGMYRFDRL